MSKREGDITLGGLTIWIDQRQFPESKDYWDANWTNANVVYDCPEARVRTSAPIIHLGDLDRWLHDLKTLNSTLVGEANLECVEPNLRVLMEASSLGHIQVRVELTPDHLYQGHWFEFEADQSYLPPLIKNLTDVLTKFPIVGTP